MANIVSREYILRYTFRFTKPCEKPHTAQTIRAAISDLHSFDAALNRNICPTSIAIMFIAKAYQFEKLSGKREQMK